MLIQSCYDLIKTHYISAKQKFILIQATFDIKWKNSDKKSITRVQNISWQYLIGDCKVEKAWSFPKKK